MKGPQRGHAVVVGASMAGLLAARVLADEFAQVTVVERDRLPSGAGPRKGVPQARHVHVLLLRGQALLECWFPGLEEELGAHGAPRLDVTRDGRWLHRAGWGLVIPSGRYGRLCTRDLREAILRDRLRGLPRVQFLEATDVVGLLADPMGTRVVGVRLRRRASGDGGPAGDGTLAADLVVDASGRGSRAPVWLRALGFPAPEERVIDSLLGYSSRFYAPPAGFAAPWQGVYVQAAPPAAPRGGGIYAIEDGRWLVTLVGMGGDYPPTSDPDFLAFARSLRSPVLYNALKTATPLSPIAGYRATENRWRTYEQLPRRPEQFVVLGDAACAFNPVYGQGMTAAALAAATLATCLRVQRRRHPDGDLHGLAARFQRRLAHANRPIWTIAALEDFRCPQTVGARPGRLDRLALRYMDRLLRRATTDRRVYLTLVEVLQLIRPLPALVTPAMLARVLGPAPRRLGRRGAAAGR